MIKFYNTRSTSLCFVLILGHVGGGGKLIGKRVTVDYGVKEFDHVEEDGSEFK